MIDQVVENYIAAVKDEILNEKMNTIPLAYLMQKQIPDSIKHYLDQEVENWILEEESKFESSDRFDYDIPEVRVKVDQIFDFLKQTATFSVNQFNQLLERAVKLEKDFTVRPQQTMTQFMFKDQANVSTKYINSTLRYFFVHNYYKEKLSEYFNMKYLYEINLEQFKALLAEIDAQQFNSADRLSEAMTVVHEIVGFIEKGGLSAERLSLDTLIRAFKDRQLDDYVAVLSALSGEDIAVTEIEALLASAGKQEPKADQSLDSFDFSNVELAPDQQEDDDFEDDEDDEENVEEVGEQLADYLANQNKRTQPLEDIHHLIDSKWRKKFIKKLFSKNEDEYVRIVDSLNEMSSWKDASIFMEDEFYEFDVNPYSKEATAFSDIVYNRFFPNDEYVG